MSRPPSMTAARVARGQGLLQPVLGQQDGGAQLPVDLSQRGQKIRGGDGVQLAGGLVQNQHVRAAWP